MAYKSGSRSKTEISRKRQINIGARARDANHARQNKTANYRYCEFSRRLELDHNLVYPRVMCGYMQRMSDNAMAKRRLCSNSQPRRQRVLCSVAPLLCILRRKELGSRCPRVRIATKLRSLNIALVLSLSALHLPHIQTHQTCPELNRCQLWPAPMLYP